MGSCSVTGQDASALVQRDPRCRGQARRARSSSWSPRRRAATGSVPLLWALLAALVVPWPLIWLTPLGPARIFLDPARVAVVLSRRAVAGRRRRMRPWCRASSSAPAPTRRRTRIRGPRPDPDPRPHGRPDLRRRGGALCRDPRRYRDRRPGRAGRSGATTIADLIDGDRAGRTAATGRAPGAVPSSRARATSCAEPRAAGPRSTTRDELPNKVIADLDARRGRHLRRTLQGRWCGVRDPGSWRRRGSRPGLVPSRACSSTT